MKIYIVIPAFNEAQHINKVIKDLKDNDYENIVVVDDGSVDDTYQQAKNNQVEVLQHVVNRGMGAALQTGNSFALWQGAEVIVHFDADGQMLASDIKAMVDPIINNQVDVTLGSRFLSARDEMPWSKKYLIQPLAKVINYFFTKLWLTDAHNGFRALSASAAKKIQVTQDRMAHNTEIVEKIKKNNLKYREIPVTIKYYEYGQSLGGGFKILRDLLLGKLIR